MNFRKSQPDDQIEINLIPLIDVLLVILIFLAATTSFHRYQQLRLTLPRATAEAQDPDALHIAVSHDGLYAVQGQLLPGTTTQDIAAALAQLAATPAGADTARPVLVIDADAQASHAAVVRVMEAARLAGIERVHFATEGAP
ncbi:biopolymer transporter ExbD [Yanghanlia caeni]|uniref:Biopolymer transporter ExbD n=1 Tax=Yanghanlia caeni TaxID=3064283 RepID=A0ABU1D6W2_9BURK|nr:biopolymer transporter ExbD [Alcaligenaceae bacterium LG-2]NGR08847.1 biopolymer transporter ExbD [bacterium SGD-2]